MLAFKTAAACLYLHLYYLCHLCKVLIHIEATITKSHQHNSVMEHKEELLTNHQTITTTSVGDTTSKTKPVLHTTVTI